MREFATLDLVQDVLSGLHVKPQDYRADVKSAPVTYRVVVSVQFYEDYGVHDWDGTGPCPQNWKANGGADYIVAEGLTENQMLTTSPEDYIPNLDLIIFRSHGFEQALQGIQFFPSNVETYEEKMCREMQEWGLMTTAQADRILARARRYCK